MPEFNLKNCDCIDLMRSLPEKSQHLIIVDPPYYKVKGEFDFIWKTFDYYLKQVEEWAIELKRILADNGSLFWWGHSKKIAYQQIILDKYFNLENLLIWKKNECQHKRIDPKSCRKFIPTSEKLLFYSNDFEPGDWEKTGLEKVMEEHIKPRHPFALYMKEEIERSGVSRKEIAALFPSRNGNLTGCVSNWLNGDNVPTEEQYLKIREFLNGDYLKKEYEDLKKEYEDLRLEYEDLRLEYEDLRLEYEEQRRVFNNLMKLEDVLEFSQETHITGRFKHPTQKPPTLCRALIQTTSKPGQNLFVPFGGSGVEAIEGYNYGLNVTVSELNQKYCKIIKDRFDEETNQLRLL